MPFGTAHDRSTPSSSSRRSKWCRGWSCSWRTNTGCTGRTVVPREIPMPVLPSDVAVLPVPELVGDPARRGEGLDGEAVLEAAEALPEGDPAAEGDRHDRQVHEVDQVGLEELADRGRAAAESDVAAVRGLLSQVQHLVGRRVHEVEA